MLINSKLKTLILSIALTGSPAGSVLAEEPGSDRPPFGKEPGSIYLGGTAGLSGADSVRGFIDSLFYAKWAAQSTAEMIGDPEGVIYGDDDRRDIYTLSDPDLIRLAQAAFVIAFSFEVSDNGNGTYDLSGNPWSLQGGLPLCEGERFAGQLQLGNCSGFLVGEDLVVTAGHCLSTCGSYAFVFGYMQTDSLTPPVLTVPEDDVYFCSEVIDRVYAGDLDHCLVRLDRPVVGHTPIPIRRSGLVPDGSPLVVVGHPTVLPLKVAAGAEVKDNRGATPWFQANTDTYGGNSGSMVVNTDTWEIEGILVRGAPDFVYTDCAASNVVPNTGNPGSGLEFEEVSKIETIAHLIPELVNSAGELSLDRPAYRCDDQVEVNLSDLDLAGLASYDVLLFTSASDSELVSLAETGTGTGLFEGTVVTGTGALVKYDGQLQVSDGDQIVAEYQDANNGGGLPATVQAASIVDCVPALISGVAVGATGATWADITFMTSEPAEGLVRAGLDCGSYSASGAGSPTTSHEIAVSSLEPNSIYRFEVEAVDQAGNQSLDDNGGACYEFVTLEAPEHFTEMFASGCDLVGQTLVFRPDGSDAFYAACRYPGTAAWFATEGSTTLSLSDDSFVGVTPSGDHQVFIYAAGYSTVYVGSNGYVTFGEGDTDWSETVEEHLAAPPRVAVFWDDLDPAQGGRVSYEALADRLLVSWEDVPEHSATNRITVQLQLFYDGTVVIIYPSVEPLDGLIGLSPGSGYPVDFVPSDLSAYGECDLVLCYADSDGDTYGADDDPGHAEPGPTCAEGSAANSLDCDDSRVDVYPGAEDIPDDAIDQDCDGIDPSCCSGKVGDVNGMGGDTPTVADASVLVDHLFVTGVPLDCYPEADINQSGERYPSPHDITVSDVSTLIDHLFITGVVLDDCL